MRRVWGRDFVVKESRENEAYTCAASAPHIREHHFQGRDRHCDDIAQDDDARGDGSEPGFSHAITLVLPRRRAWRRIRSPYWPPLEYRINRGSAWVDLKRVRKHDKNDNGGLANGGTDDWSI